MISKCEKLIVKRLMEYKQMFGIVSGNVFTKNTEADQLIKKDWNAYLFAVIFDQQIKAERAWAIPLELKKRLGHLDVNKMASMDDEHFIKVFQKPTPLHRWKNKMPKWIKSACKKLIADYGGLTENIWKDTKDAKKIIERFDNFDGISQKKSTMSVNILVNVFKIPLTNCNNIDISVDVMIRRVFERVGLVPKNASNENIIKKARQLMPSFPGNIDFPVWDIGRNWCSRNKPDCYYNEVGKDDNCPLVNECQSVKLFFPVNQKMNEEILADIRNKLTVPKTTLEKLSKGEQVPAELLKLSFNELDLIDGLLRELESHSDTC